MLMGGLIAFERESVGKPAGLQTHILAAGAAALSVELADIIVVRIGSQARGDMIRYDPIGWLFCSNKRPPVFIRGSG